MTTRCFMCQEQHKLTVEHIIPQALGGVLKARLFCKDCNSQTGYLLDSEICKQFGYVSNLLNIRRDRPGRPQPFEVKEIHSKEPLIWDVDSLSRKSPEVKIELTGGKITYAEITARSKSELKKICDSIQKKHHISDGFNTFPDKSTKPVDVEYEMVIDNGLLRRAISKIAYGFICTKLPENMVFSQQFDPIREYILSPDLPDLASGNYSNTGFLVDNIRPLHKLHVSHNQEEEILVGYVSLFGVYRFTVLLAEGIKSMIRWPSLVYSFNPVRRQVVTGNPYFAPLPISKQDVLHPRQSKSLVQAELERGLKVIEAYKEGFESLGGELSK